MRPGEAHNLTNAIRVIEAEARSDSPRDSMIELVALNLEEAARPEYVTLPPEWKTYFAERAATLRAALAAPSSPTSEGTPEPPSLDHDLAASIDAVADALNAWDQGEEPRPDTSLHWNRIVAALRAAPSSPTDRGGQK
jgi:hypothetical protein